jgi:hypothetical protein
VRPLGRCLPAILQCAILDAKWDFLGARYCFN